MTDSPAEKPSDLGPPPRATAFLDPELPDEQRLDVLLSEMTRDEKVACLGTRPAVPRLGIQASDHVEGLHGLALGGPGRWGGDEPVATTSFPQSIGLAQTWNAELLQRIAAAEGREARYAFHVKQRGGLVIRAPNADLGRDPRWGRTEECYGEDAFLTSRLVTAFVRGLQGDHPRYWQAASLMKHFLANSNEDERDTTSSNFDERVFYEYYSAPFRHGIEAGHSRAFMAAYNLYNDEPCTVHPVLRNVTMQRWGNDGIICTDAGALGNLVNSQRRYSELPAAAAAAVRAGITQFLDKFSEAVHEALNQGLLSEAELDDAVRRNFRVMLKLGLLDPTDRVPYAQIDARKVPWESAEHRELALEATRQSIVLLKNSEGLLPLDPKQLKRVLVVGRRAEEVLLDWYSGTPPYAVTPLAALERRFGPGVEVSFARDNEKGRAAELAQRADLVIACVGNHPTGDAGWAQVTLPSYGKEAVDRKSLDLEDEALLQAVHRENQRMVVVLMANFPYAIHWTAEHVPAIVLMTHASQEQGNGLADVLLGTYNPGGRLVQTWPRSLDDLPPVLDYDLSHGRTYMYAKRPPLFPFGFGLSYTRFELEGLRATNTRLDPSNPLRFSVNLKNVGARSGDHVVQLYVRRPASKIARPQQELKGFARVSLAAGASQLVGFELTQADLSHWDVATQRFLVEPGPLEIRVGHSSADIAEKISLNL
ncbi:MAG: glycoside hydrolase family 3 C-terminal domain-containing protein [Myxococcota bacterium]